MIESRFTVPQEFENVFSHFYFAENNTIESITKTLLPSFQTILVFNFGSPVSLLSQEKTKIKMKKCLLIGPIRKSFDYTIPAGASIFVANFKDDAFFRFFGSIPFLEDSPLHPDELMKENCFTQLWHDLSKLKSIEKRIDFVLEFSRPYLRKRTAIAKAIAAFDDEYVDTIKGVAEQTDLSKRTIQLHQKKILGFSAKELSRYRRFMKAIELLENLATGNEKPDWFEIIERCGYYDQSQMIHDFKHFTNLSPRKFLKFQQDICNPSS